MICGTVLLRSLDVYRVTAMAEKRLQARASAEGAVVVLLGAPDRQLEPLRIGPCLVAFSPSTSDGEELRVPFMVDVMGSADKPFMSVHYVARFGLGGTGSWEFRGLETNG